MKRVILKISGEALANQSGSGINPKYINKIAKEIKALHDKGAQIGIVNGAGNMWRGRDAKEYGMPGNYMAGANIAGFLKVAEAMKAQGNV